MFKKPSIVIAALAVSAAMPMSAFAQSFQFYQEDVSRYNHGDAASTRWVQYADGAIDTRPYGWMKTYTARGGLRQKRVWLDQCEPHYRCSGTVQRFFAYD